MFSTAESSAVVNPLTVTVLSVAQDVYEAGIGALAVIKRLEDTLADSKTLLVARVSAAAAVEASAACLDPWQRG